MTEESAKGGGMTPVGREKTSRKKIYEAPKLEVYGKIAELTKATGDKGLDGFIGSTDGT